MKKHMLPIFILMLVSGNSAPSSTMLNMPGSSVPIDERHKSLRLEPTPRRMQDFKQIRVIEVQLIKLSVSPINFRAGFQL